MKSILAACVCALPVAAAAPEVHSGPSPAERAFERFQSMEGRWAGASTKGWRNEVEYSVIARGSVVMAVSEFEAHPGETMVTMYSLHEGELLLTHYCVAGNQPRLVASEIDEQGAAVHFTWRDGTGLEDRDEGHMDEARMRFHDDGSFSSQWTWYENGESSWMEEIRLERVE